jgi:hypothetical protein
VERAVPQAKSKLSIDSIAKKKLDGEDMSVVRRGAVAPAKLAATQVLAAVAININPDKPAPSSTAFLALAPPLRAPGRATESGDQHP